MKPLRFTPDPNSSVFNSLSWNKIKKKQMVLVFVEFFFFFTLTQTTNKNRFGEGKFIVKSSSHGNFFCIFLAVSLHVLKRIPLAGYFSYSLGKMLHLLTDWHQTTHRWYLPTKVCRRVMVGLGFSDETN